MATPADDYAAISKQIDPNSQIAGTQQFVQDEAMGTDAGAGGMFAGFKFPEGMTQGDMGNLLTQAEAFGSSTGYKYFPSATDMMGAWKAGATDFQSMAKIWAAKLPPQYGFLRHGMTSTAFSAYKEQASNKAAVQQRYGVNGDTDINYINHLDNPQQAANASGAQAIGSASQGGGAAMAQKSAIR